MTASGRTTEGLAVAGKKQPDDSELPAALRQSLEELLARINNDLAKRELWAKRFTAADRSKFKGEPSEVLKQHNIIHLWQVARGTPTWNGCIVEVAYAIGFINSTRRETLLCDLGSIIPASNSRLTHGTPVPHWNNEARELRYRGKVVRVVKRPNQAYNIVTILKAFEAAGWPPRIDDPHHRKRTDETRRRDISNLNSGLNTSLMMFACDGNGTGFLWKPIPRPKAKKKAAKRRRP